MTPTWHLLTGEYPPDPGGVADYTFLVAEAFAAAGDRVVVWANAGPPATPAAGVTVHRVGFGPAGLVRLTRGLARFPGPRTLLVQYVPHAFGMKAMNVPFAAWLLARRRGFGDDVRVMFHEPMFPFARRPLKHNAIAAATRAMAVLTLAAATRAYVSTPRWIDWLRPWGGRRVPISWLPVPANVPDSAAPEAIAAARAAAGGGPLVGHFGTYGGNTVPQLTPALETLLAAAPAVRVRLVGGGGDRYRGEFVKSRPQFAGRVTAVGRLDGAAVAANLRACDLAVQPYPDGASARRGSLMAVLANGVPVVSTLGIETEPVFRGAGLALFDPARPAEMGLAAARMMLNPAELSEHGRRGRALYVQSFSLDRTVREYRACPPAVS